MSVLSAQDQKDSRRAMVDSITVRLLRFTITSPEDLQDISINEAARVEYLAYRTSSELFYEIMSDMSEDEIRKVKEYVYSKPFGMLYSREFWNTYGFFVLEAYMKEIGKNDRFSYRIRDEKFAGLVDRVRSESVYLTNMLVEAVENALEFNASLDRNAMQRVIHEVPNLYVKTLMEYLDDEDVPSVDFVSHDRMNLLLKKNTFRDTTRRNHIMNEIYNAPDILEQIGRYVMYDRERVCFSAETASVSRHEIKEKKYVYNGTLRDGIPHGYGVMTDTKGVRYEGDFKNGERHGLVYMIMPGKDTVAQVWADGKLQKGIPAVRAKGGFVQIPELYGGRSFGYGKTYDITTQTSKEGFFIDGRLNHDGKIITPGMEMEGKFVDGELKEGSIRWKSSEWKLKEFSGECNGIGGLRRGTLRYISNDGKYIKTSQGVFVGEYLDGPGKVMIVGRKSDMVQEGVFVKGVLWGKGSIKRIVKTHTEGVAEEQQYDGWLAKGLPHGEGTVTLIFKNLPDRNYNLTRYGVKISPCGPGETVVHMEGIFEGQKLVKGKVLYSDGSYMQGIFKDGKPAEGRMLKNYSDGSRYDGECRNGKYHGYGCLVYADGTEYKGLFENGYVVDKAPDSMSGQKFRPDAGIVMFNKLERVFKFENLKVEAGVARLVKAAGVKILVRGVSSVEVVCEGVFDGDILKNGKVTVSDGNWLEGRFEDGVLIEGKGQTVDKYGTVYVGDIRNGFPHGKGKCTYKNGTWFQGNFSGGKRMNGTHYSIDGRVIKVYE